MTPPAHLQRDSVPRTAVAAIIERELAKRPDGERGDGRIREFVTELAASSGTPSGWERRIYSIRTGHALNRQGEVTEQKWVQFDVVDRLLTALDLTHLWFTELAEWLPPLEGADSAPADLVGDALVAMPERCPQCDRRLHPDYEPAGVEERGCCALCVARATTTRLRRGQWTHSLLFALYERYLLTGESDENLLRAHGVEATSSRASGLAGRWKELGWPRRTRHQSKRLRHKLHPTPPLMPLVFRQQSDNPERLVRQLHALHWHRGASINAMARELAPRWGVRQNSLNSNISRAFSLLGLKAQDRIAMTVAASTKHGLARRSRPKNGGKFGNGSKSLGYKRWLLNERAGAETRNPLCSETTTRGKPCTHRALDGKSVCFVHDPERRAAVVARCAEMRTRSPIHDPELLEDAEPLRDLLRDYQAGGGQWRTLASATDIPEHWLSHIAKGKQERVGRGRADAIRAALLSEAVAA